MRKMILTTAAFIASAGGAYAEGPASGPSSQAKPAPAAQKSVGVDQPVPTKDAPPDSKKPATNPDPGGMPPTSAEPKK